MQLGIVWIEHSLWYAISAEFLGEGIALPRHGEKIQILIETLELEIRANAKITSAMMNRNCCFSFRVYFGTKAGYTN